MDYIKTFNFGNFTSQPKIKGSNFLFSASQSNGSYELVNDQNNSLPIFSNPSNENFSKMENRVRSFNEGHYIGLQKNSFGTNNFINVYPTFIQPYQSNSLFSNKSNYLNFNFPEDIDNSLSTTLGFLFYSYLKPNEKKYLNLNILDSTILLSFEYLSPLADTNSSVTFGLLFQQDNVFYEAPISFLDINQNMTKVNISKAISSLDIKNISENSTANNLDLSGQKPYQIGFYSRSSGDSIQIYFSNFTLDLENFSTQDSFLFYNYLNQDLLPVISTSKNDTSHDYIYGSDEGEVFVFNSALEYSPSYSSKFSYQNGYIHKDGLKTEVEGTLLENPDNDNAMFNSNLILGTPGNPDPDPFNKPNNSQGLSIFDFTDLGLDVNNMLGKLIFNFEGYIIEYNNYGFSYNLPIAIANTIIEFRKSHPSTGIHLDFSGGINFLAWRPKGGADVYFSCEVIFENDSVTINSNLK